MLTRILPIVASTLVFLGFSSTAIGSSTFQVERTIQDERGRSITVTILLRENSDDTDTIVGVAPEQDARSFFDRACKEEYGPNFQWVDITEHEVTLSKSAGYTYSCYSESPGNSRQ